MGSLKELQCHPFYKRPTFSTKSVSMEPVPKTGNVNKLQKFFCMRMHRIFNIPLFCRKSENIRTKPKKNIGNPRFFIEHGKHKFFCRGLIFYVG